MEFLTDARHTTLRREQVLAYARTVLTIGGLIAVWLAPTEPAHHAAFVYSLLIAYSIYAMTVAGVLHAAAEASERTAAILHAVDFVLAGILTSFTAGPGSPLFAFFFLVLATATYRGGLRRALQTAAALSVVLIVEALIVSRGSTGTLDDLNFLMMRVVYLHVMAFLLGYLAENDRALQDEAVAIARALARIRDAASYTAAVHEAADELCVVFDASAVALVVENDGSLLRWTIGRGQQNGEAPSERKNVPAADRDLYFRDPVPDTRCWYARSGRAGSSQQAILQKVRGRVQIIKEEPPDALFERLHGTTVVCYGTAFDHWKIRVFLLDPRSRLPLKRLLPLYCSMLEQIAPALYGAFLARQVRSQAVALERQRLARELHDRVIQSLIGFEMQIAAKLKREPPREELTALMTNIRGQLRDEVDSLRDLINELRPPSITGAELPQFIAQIVRRFEQTSDVRAVFMSDASVVQLTKRESGEVARIIQEALVNVRKHSGATHVIVRLTHRHTGLMLSIEDDGRGFEFSGLLEDQELWERGLGPMVIKERVRAIGGSLTVESRPGEGSRVDVLLPHAR